MITWLWCGAKKKSAIPDSCLLNLLLIPVLVAGHRRLFPEPFGLFQTAWLVLSSSPYSAHNMEKRLRFASLQQYFTFWKHYLPSFFPKPGVGSFMNQAGLRALPLLCAFSDWALSGLKRDVQRQQGLSWSTSSSTLWDRRIISHLVGSTYGFVLHKYDAFLLRNSRALRSPCQLVIQHYPSVFLASFPPVVLLLKCSLLQ